MNEHKKTMELVWHNCRLYQPEEAFNERLWVTNGVQIVEVAWWRGVGYKNGKFFIDISEEKSEQWWWADFRRTTKEFFKN